jgi:hypothetical protein
MADALDSKKISAFIDNATPADTDYFLNATGNVMKKTKVSQLITWLKEKLGINALNTKLTDYVMIKTFSKSVTLSNGGGDILFSNIALTGYTAIGIVQCSFSSSWIAPTGMYVDSAGAHVTVRDVGSPTSSSVTVNCYTKVLYVKK